MMSENSLFSNFTALQINITKRRKWLILLAFVTYLLYDVGILLLLLSNQTYLRSAPKWKMISWTRRLLGPYAGNGFITAVGSVLLAIEGFRWLSNRQMLDFYESQPFSRMQHFFGVVFNSTLILFLSHLTGTLLGLLSACAFGSCSVNVVSSAFSCLGLDMTIFAAVFSIAILAVMLTGNLVVSVIATVVLLVYESALKVCLNSSLALLPGYAGSGISYRGIFSPILSLIPDTKVGVVENLICAGIVMTISLFLYRIRKNEDAGKAVPLKVVRIIVKISVVFVIALLTGLVFNDEGGTQSSIIAMIISSLVIGGAMETIYNSDIRKIFKGFGFTLLGGLLAIAVLLSCRMDLFGYSHWVPKEKDVKSAWICLDYEFDHAYEEQYMKLTDIKTVNALLKSGEEGGEGETLFDLTISYRMKNGRTESRRISVPESSKDLMAKIFETDEFKEGYFEVYHDEDIRGHMKNSYVSYSNFGGDADESEATEMSSKVYDAIRSAYIEDLKKYDFETAAYRKEIGEIYIYVPESEKRSKSYNLPVYQSFTNTIAVLKEKNMYRDPVEEIENGGPFYTDPKKASY